MGSSKSVKPRRSPMGWEVVLFAAKELIDYRFPDKNSYDDSQWGQWVARIEKGHTDDEEWIDDFVKSNANNPKYEDGLGEIVGDELAKAEELTNSMYAALIVTLWSQVELYLKTAARVVDMAKNRSKKALEENIKYGFNDIKGFLKKEVRIKVEDCAKCDLINAVRILNNSFKHSGGYYRPMDEKPHNVIEKSLLSNWEIADKNDGRHIFAYSQLPIKDVVADCRIFFKDLFDKLEKALDNSREVANNGE